MKITCSKRIYNRNTRYIRSAEGDYIKIGNRILPTDASGYGYDASYDDIARDTKRRYDAEKAAEREEAEKARKAEAGSALYEECKAAINDSMSTDDKMEALFHILVPSSGPADNLAGELIRAAMRIAYRWYNDGDYFYTGYGLETAGSSAAFIADVIGGSVRSTIAELTELYPEDSDSQYEAGISNIEDLVIKYIMDNPDTFGTDTEDSRNYDSDTLNDMEEASHNLEFDIDDTYEVHQYTKNGCISWEDFRQMLEDMAGYFGGTVNQWARNAFTIRDLDYEQLKEWEYHYPKELGSYLSQLEEEFPNYGEDEEYGEEYDEEDY